MNKHLYTHSGALDILKETYYPPYSNWIWSLPPAPGDCIGVSLYVALTLIIDGVAGLHVGSLNAPGFQKVVKQQLQKMTMVLVCAPYAPLLNRPLQQAKLQCNYIYTTRHKGHLKRRTFNVNVSWVTDEMCLKETFPQPGDPGSNLKPLQHLHCWGFFEPRHWNLTSSKEGHSKKAINSYVVITLVIHS